MTLLAGRSMRTRMDRGVDAHGGLNPNLDSLAFTDSVTACREALRCAAGVLEGPIERHSGRVFFIMERLAHEASIPLDREVAGCATPDTE